LVSFKSFDTAILFLFGRSIHKRVSVCKSDIAQNFLHCAETIYLIEE